MDAMKMKQVCDEILAIMDTYNEQIDSKYGLGSPGGLEHMGDVWTKLAKWEQILKG